MGTIMQRIRDHILNQTFIILQRQPQISNTQNESSQLGNSNSVIDASKDHQADSETENERTRSIKRKDTSSKSNTVQQTNVQSHHLKNSEQKCRRKGKDILESSESKEFEVYLTSLYANLKSGNSLEIRCAGALNLALCLAYDSPDIELEDCFNAFKDLSDSYNFPHLALCHALLLCAFTKMSVSLDDLISLEKNIISLTGSLKMKDIDKMPEMYKVSALMEGHKEIMLKLCKEVFQESYLDLEQIDISTICCCSLYNLSSLVKQFDNDLGASYNFKDITLKYILAMTGKSTQEIVSDDMNFTSQINSSPSISLHRLKQCLQVLEHALSINPDLSYRAALQQECTSLPYSLTRLLGWSVSSVFPVTDKILEESNTNYFTFHLSTLVCILKILSILTFNPDQYDNFTNVNGLMEKIFICTLKAYFESEKNHFDIQILCLEMLINLYIKNQKTFIVLCLKRFKISDTEKVLAVEALLKMLSDNLEKIKEVKEQYPQRNNKGLNESPVQESRIDVNKDQQKEDPVKKPRKETAENISIKDPIKKPRKETDEGVSNDDPIKKPRKETVEDVLKNDTVNKCTKEVDDASSENISDESKNAHAADVSSTPTEKQNKETTAETDAVLQAASKDMEHSTIVAFICVLIVFFIRTKQNFKEFILERLSGESLKEATIVSKKFLEFASLTGGMPVTGILILTQTITKLQSLQS